MNESKKISEFKLLLKEKEIYSECLASMDNGEFEKAVECFDDQLILQIDVVGVFGRAAHLLQTVEAIW